MSRSSLVIVGILASAYVIRPANAPVVQAGPPVIEEAPIGEGQDQTTTLDD